ncbi:DUF2515 family protein [Rossellomorea aquimaris]|uniref:DUF2515 family protein n=1 Tax=Rossellomorea aquimaris TaxID=189382 RepID=UPI001E3BFEC2|nr:DUF2515 family protein [Rossellomorea aquimaris]
MDQINNTYRFIPHLTEDKLKAEWIKCIQSCVQLYNQDNISRTIAYQKFFFIHPEVKWAYLASMVSRNAGWNMTDLKGATFPELINLKTRDLLFMTYERANWSIFQDAFPQLLIYHYSTEYNKKMFHLLKEFHVSSFMEYEWNMYWDTRDESRLVKALIINEQNLIQHPVIEHPVYKKRIFGSSLFYLEEHFHFCSVIFPTLNGELIGASVHGFRHVDNRIELGKILFNILFNPKYFHDFLEFSSTIKHTGSRTDYEGYCKNKLSTRTPPLHKAYKKVSHHWREIEDWSNHVNINPKWFEDPLLPKEVDLTEWFSQKQKQLKRMVKVKKSLYHFLKK